MSLPNKQAPTHPRKDSVLDKRDVLKSTHCSPNLPASKAAGGTSPHSQKSLSPKECLSPTCPHSLWVVSMCEKEVNDTETTGLGDRNGRERHPLAVPPSRWRAPPSALVSPAAPVPYAPSKTAGPADPLLQEASAVPLGRHSPPPPPPAPRPLTHSAAFPGL